MLVEQFDCHSRPATANLLCLSTRRQAMPLSMRRSHTAPGQRVRGDNELMGHFDQETAWTSSPGSPQWVIARPSSHPEDNGRVESPSLEDRFHFLRENGKRTRKLLTGDQTRLMEAILERTVYPSTALREAIARHLGISPRKVQIWFQNKRQGQRRTSTNSIAGGGALHPESSARLNRQNINAAGGAYLYSTQSAQLLQCRSAEDNLRLACLVDQEGRHFPELQLPRSPTEVAPSPREVPILSRQGAATGGMDRRLYYEGAGTLPARVQQGQELQVNTHRSDHRYTGAEVVKFEQFSNASHEMLYNYAADKSHDLTKHVGNRMPLSRILPPPSPSPNQPAMSRFNATLAGVSSSSRHLVSLSDVALSRPEQVPALLCTIAPETVHLSPLTTVPVQLGRNRNWTGITAMNGEHTSNSYEESSISSCASSPVLNTPLQGEYTYDTSMTGVVGDIEIERHKTLPSIAEMMRA